MAAHSLSLSLPLTLCFLTLLSSCWPLLSSVCADKSMQGAALHLHWLWGDINHSLHSEPNQLDCQFVAETPSSRASLHLPEPPAGGGESDFSRLNLIMLFSELSSLWAILSSPGGTSCVPGLCRMAALRRKEILPQMWNWLYKVQFLWDNVLLNLDWASHPQAAASAAAVWGRSPKFLSSSGGRPCPVTSCVVGLKLKQQPHIPNSHFSLPFLFHPRRKLIKTLWFFFQREEIAMWYVNSNKLFPMNPSSWLWQQFTRILPRRM